MSRRDAIAGCLLGGAIGDALGGLAERGDVCLSDDTQLTLAAARAMADGAFQDVLEDLVTIGGDTDTIASIAGQVAGAWIGARALPRALVDRVPDRALVDEIVRRYADWVERAIPEGT
jgi:ADP-ribosylglycohydrolase